MPWRIRLSRRAERDLADLPSRDRDAIRRALDRLAVDLSAGDLKKLSGRVGEWRLRVGRWRLILELDNVSGIATVSRILARKDAY
jgi:mRNA interferase RelE/StbE